MPRRDPRWLYSLAAMAFLATCMVMCYLWHLVTELSKELADQAHTDPLTGALNRRAMEEAALRETARSIRHGHPLCMIVLRLDSLQELNDARGHAAGDYAPTGPGAPGKGHAARKRPAGPHWRRRIHHPAADTAASTGIVAAERLRQAVEALEVPFENQPIRFTISAGVAQFDSSQGDWESMMRCADAAMYDAKEHGRNAVAHGGRGRNPPVHEGTCVV